MLLAAQVLLATIGTAIGLTAIRWIRTRPADDPASDRLLLVISPLLWLIRRWRQP